MASFVTCNAMSREAIQMWAQKLNTVIHEYRWIVDAYVSDFYTHNHWHKLLHSVQEYFNAVESPDLAWMLDFNKSGQSPLSKSVIPLSLLALHCCIESLSLQRVMVDIDSSETRSSLSLSLCPSRANALRDGNSTLKRDSLWKTEASHKPNYKNGQCMDMQHIFRKHVKPKKQHEIDKLGQVISLMSQLSSCNNVVDVGAGLGHLSRLLAFQHGLKVTTVEAVGGHAPTAAAYDRELNKDVHKLSKRKMKIASVDLAMSNQSVTNSKDLNAIKRLMKNEKLSSKGNVDLDCDSILIGSLLNIHCTTESLSCLNITENNLSSRLVNLKYNENGSNCDLQTSNQSNERTNKCQDSSEVSSSARPVVSNSEDVLPNHVIFRVLPDIASSQFLDIIRQTAHTDSDKGDKTSNNFILVGLHACGDLTPTLLRVFVNCKTAAALASVACCYMKISPSRPDCSTTEAIELDNYPMSKYVRGLPHYQLSYVARELACHFSDAYLKRLKDNSPHLKIHSFRAALQYLIKTLNPAFKSGTVRLLTKGEAGETFQQYMSQHLKKVNIDINIVPQDLIEHCESQQQFWKRAVAFYTLRLSLAPIVETLIILDRALFLLENGIQCALVPVFDSTISPRNFALLAVKDR